MSTSQFTQQTFAIQYKNALTSFNSQYDTSSIGTYWDVTANATGSVVKELADWQQQISDGNVPENASPELLRLWAATLGLAPQKPGNFAKGTVSIVSSTYPVTIPAGTVFSVVTLQYITDSDFVLEEDGNVAVTAEQVGAEYNLFSGLGMDNSLGVTSTCLGIFGGTGEETSAELLARIELNVQNRKTDGMLTDYLQRALELYNYAEAETIFVEDIVPYGVKLYLANTIEDYDAASENPVLNDISLSTEELQDAEEALTNYSIVTGIVDIDTYSTQDVTNLIIYVYTTTGEDLTVAEIDEIQKATRKSLLEFNGTVLTRHSLEPELPSYVEDYFFNGFSPIARISPLMDSINIGVVLATS